MDVLLEEIRSKDEAAASVLEQADLRSDSDLQLLTLQDLGELFPGVKHVKLRRKIFNIIQTLKPIDVLIKEFKGFIPHESLRAALTEHGVLVNYLKMLKEMKIQMNKVQDFLDAHINLLEDFRKSQPSQDQDKDSSSSSPEKRHNSQTCEPSQKQQDTSTNSPMLSPPSPTSTGDHPEKRQDSSSSSPEKRHNSQTCEPSQKQQDTSTSSANWLSSFAVFKRDHPEKRQATLKYKMVISGKTFNAHQQILEKVKALSEDPDLNLIEQEESDQYCQAIIVFCPIVSRMGTDIDAAMMQVKGSQPVILVLMHHAREPKHVTLMKTWDGVSNVVLLFHVFYHETVHGLLECQQNNSAISDIRNALLEHADIQTVKEPSGKAQNVAAESSSGYKFGSLILRKPW